MNPFQFIRVGRRKLGSNKPSDGKEISQLFHFQSIFNLCQETGYETFVVTDNDEIEQNVRTFSENVLRVDDDVASGTERIALAYERHLKDRGPLNK